MSGDKSPLMHLYRRPIAYGGESRDGVEIWYDGVIYAVVPTVRGGVPQLTYYAERPRDDGGVLDADGGRLDRTELAVIALNFAREYDARVGSRATSEDGSHKRVVGYIEFAQPMPGKAVRRVRPDDDTLLRLARDTFASGLHPRHLLSKRYGVTVRTADDWIEHARTLPGGADLPRPKPGRPRKTSTKGSNR